MTDGGISVWGPGHRAGEMARSGWGVILLGAVSLVAGVLVLAWPGATLLAIAIVFAVQVLVGGVLRLVAALSAEEIRGGGRVLLALLAIVSILAGVLFLRHPFQTLTVLTLLLGLFWVMAGVLETVHAAGARDMPARGWAVAGGVLGVLAGIAVLAYPGMSLLVLVWFLGLELLIYGAFTITRGVRIRAARP
ncbi:HdeD family acid-resistance protein [Amycolatopsis sp. K13G38]|uniref:HdeD family acid-resistance protein n=1 Tax=Amycolatopsis acididurans TaxID=2724524 RepID=A0ABX1J8K9_9PSEU|nr:DUF308 domain-containing protein [Amycolatopsis acididurans]NKQ54637.1 HdeD family acid-resistance protein [Amycolatopsis acididurans]